MAGKKKLNLCDDCIYERNLCGAEEAASSSKAISQCTSRRPPTEVPEVSPEPEKQPEEVTSPFIASRQPEELGICTACDWRLRRTAFNHHWDAVRCVNPRCTLYREIIKRLKSLTLK